MSGTAGDRAADRAACAGAPRRRMRLRGVAQRDQQLHPRPGWRPGSLRRGAQRRLRAWGSPSRDPSADVDGLDAASKLMALSAWCSATAARARRGRTCAGSGARAGRGRARHARPGASLSELATLDRRSRGPVARVGPEALDPSDPLAAADGNRNAIVCEAEPARTDRDLGSRRRAGAGRPGRAGGPDRRRWKSRGRAQRRATSSSASRAAT